MAEDEKTKFPLAAPVFASENYGDDLFCGGVDQPSRLVLRDQLNKLALSGGFRLRKWFSNCSDLLQVVYLLVVTTSDYISVKILMSKTKVALIKTISIPNLELCAAALLTTLILFIVQSLQLNDVPILGWTDSTIVLDWL